MGQTWHFTFMSVCKLVWARLIYVPRIRHWYVWRQHKQQSKMKNAPNHFPGTMTSNNVQMTQKIWFTVNVHTKKLEYDV